MREFMTPDGRNEKVSEVLLEFAPREISCCGNENEVTQKFAFGNLAIITCLTRRKRGFSNYNKTLMSRNIKIEPLSPMNLNSVLEFTEESNMTNINDATAKLFIRSYDGHPWTLHWGLDYCLPVLFLARCERDEDSTEVMERIYIPIGEDRYCSLDNCQPGYPSLEIIRHSEFEGDIRRLKRPCSIDGKCPICNNKLW